ncbi:MAG: putative sugar O-methyltransferase [Patescibacteria group bacterium]
MQKVKQIISKIYRYSYSVLTAPFERRISKKDFEVIYSEMKNLYLVNKDNYDFSEFIVPQWNKNMLEIEKYFSNNFSFSFLNHQVIKATMFMYTHSEWKNIQKELISTYLTRNKAKEILREYNIGKPLLNDIGYVTSGNNIHHLYHLIKFFKETETNSSNINTVVEVGGGYGNMSKIYKKMNKESTYIIIDIPIFSYIQAVYLKTIFGREAVHIVHNNKIYIKKGSINVIPLNKKIFGEISKIISGVDLFISTWALSESNEAMQSYVKSIDYFKAKYLLLAYQKSADTFAFAEDIKNVTEIYDKIYDEETEYVKDNYYLFCKRK